MTNCPGDQVAVEPDAVSKNRGVTLRQNDKVQHVFMEHFHFV